MDDLLVAHDLADEDGRLAQPEAAQTGAPTQDLTLEFGQRGVIQWQAAALARACSQHIGKPADAIGLVGLALVSVYLLAYYKLAGLVALLGLVFSGLLLWTIISYIGETQGLALTLSGVVGLIVAIGVSADSNIVYFENVKDAFAEGRHVSTAIERAYDSAISTIFKADIVSLIAAGLLYFLTVGAVRGFALYLGLATILDLVISVAFMRPALKWIAARSAVEANPRLVGMPGGAS